MASPVPDLPLWAWNLIIAVQGHEEQHGSTDRCLNAVLAAVPTDVQNQAAAINAYVRQAEGNELADKTAKNWDDMISRFGGIFGDQPTQKETP
ncbi:hypothetical protein [Streptomyces sp. STCH 565 A]|uniref:hypothetical protein n=1 Tax=Streptomyces sp. STCH 565 A TaxID=2950532 RepID=UPI00207532F5|nr:hypothetical protein [Streptomyces sp. STCH 565 A]MCM8552322.1 hypothetical protein [Streptomyces sp. STCH 565 A]